MTRAFRALAVVAQDVRFGCRMLTKSPMLTLAAIVCLALGIGANTTIFSMVNGVALRPLPLPHSERLYQVSSQVLGRTGLSLSLPNFVDLRKRLAKSCDGRTFDEVGLFDTNSFNLGRGARAERVQGAVFSATMFPLLHVQPELGRVFTEEEDRAGAPRVLLISHKLWQRKYASDPGIVGRKIPFHGREATVLGVMPANFQFPLYSEVFVPVGLDYAKADRASGWMSGLARLADGVSIEQARSEIESVSADLAKKYHQGRGHWRATLRRLRDFYLPSDVRTMLVLFPIAVLLVLLIACVNVANLLIAKGMDRQRELAIRAALGATRGRIVRQLLTESMLLAWLGAAAGLLLALWGIDLMMAAVQIPIPYWIHLDIDKTVLLYSLALALVAGVVSGAVPALQASRTDLTTDLKDAGSNATASRSRHAFRNALIIVQVTAAVTLLIFSGIMIQNLIRLQHVNPGFNPHNVLTGRVELPASKYPSSTQIRAFLDRSKVALGAIPGVVRTAICDRLPMSGSSSDSSITVEGAVPPGPNEQTPWAYHKLVDSDYFATMEIPLRRGHIFDDRALDHPNAPRQAVINETMARRYWHGRDAVGKRFSFGDEHWLTIAGVVGDIKYRSLDESPTAVAYLPMSQYPNRVISFVLRTERSPLDVASPLRAALHDIDADLPLHAVLPMTRIIRLAMWTSEFFAQVLGVLGAVALFLASLGLYSVIAFSVTQRTHEIGIRMALGASRGNVVRLVLRQGILLAVAGVLLGLILSIGLTKLLIANVPNMEAEYLTFVVAPVLIMAVALFACWLPARRATRIDPMTALRFE